MTPQKHLFGLSALHMQAAGQYMKNPPAGRFVRRRARRIAGITQSRSGMVAQASGRAAKAGAPTSLASTVPSRTTEEPQVRLCAHISAGVGGRTRRIRRHGRAAAGDCKVGLGAGHLRVGRLRVEPHPAQKGKPLGGHALGAVPDVSDCPGPVRFWGPCSGASSKRIRRSCRCLRARPGGCAAWPQSRSRAWPRRALAIWSCNKNGMRSLPHLQSIKNDRRAWSLCKWLTGVSVC